MLGLFLPKSNPDFEDKIDEAKEWLLEFPDEVSVPVREIGLSKSGEVLLKMPYKNNYGFWTDNNMLLADFQERFQTESISKDEFEIAWSSAFTDDDRGKMKASLN